MEAKSKGLQKPGIIHDGQKIKALWVFFPSTTSLLLNIGFSKCFVNGFVNAGSILMLYPPTSHSLIAFIPKCCRVMINLLEHNWISLCCEMSWWCKWRIDAGGNDISMLNMESMLLLKTR